MAEHPMNPKPSYLTPNSHKYKAEQADKKRVEKVVQGKATRKSDSGSAKLAKAIFAEDVNDVKEYLVWDVLLPALKDTISDLFKKGIDAMLFGDSRPNTVKRSGSTSKVSYSSYYEREKERKNRGYRRYNRRAGHSFDDVIFERRNDAENVLEQLVDITYQYGLCSVADFYELAGIDSEYTDEKWGWGELSEARVERVRNGYIVNLPKPEQLD